MLFADGLRHEHRIWGRGVLIVLSIAALSTLGATAHAKKSQPSSFPPAPDPRGPAGSQPKPTPAPAPAAPTAAATPTATPPAAAPAPAPVAAPAPAAAAPAPAPAAPSGVPTVVPQTPTEIKAAKMSAEALGPIFRNRGFKAGEAKLRDAIRICGPEVCSAPFQARLHRDLGFLLIEGQKRLDDGKDEFTVALTLDPTTSLTERMLSLSVTTAFAEIRTALGAPADAPTAAAAAPAPARAPAKKSEDTGEREETEKSESSTLALNWVSLTIQQDLVYHSPTKDVCSTDTGSPYRCYDAYNVPVAHPAAYYVPGSDQVSSGGAILATTRILAGYDRVVADNITVGARLGMVVSGKGLRLTTDSPFLQLHAEARAALWLLKPAAAKKGIKPYLYLGAGMGEADGKITVNYIIPGDSNVYKAVAWKRSGHTFISPGIGVQAPFGNSGGPLAELRFMQFLSPNVPVIAVDIGYAYGF